jgi:hypothetical protein
MPYPREMKRKKEVATLCVILSSCSIVRSRGEKTVRASILRKKIPERRNIKPRLICFLL